MPEHGQGARRLWLVLARPLRVSVGAEILLQEGFDGEAVQRICDGRKRRSGSFAAVMDAEGRFAVLADGRVFDPLGTAGHDGTGCDGAGYAACGCRAHDAGQALFQRMDLPPWQELCDQLEALVAAEPKRWAWRAVGGGVGVVALVVALSAAV